jgi:transposase
MSNPMSNPMNAILGIDIAKAKFDVCLLNQAAQVTGRFANSDEGLAKLSRWLVTQGADQVHACLEATGRYGRDLAYFLHSQGHTVSIVNPQRIHAYSRSKLQRSKTDRLDAQLIADFCRTQQPPATPLLSVPQEERQALSRHLEALKHDRQRERNRLQAGNPSVHVRQAIQEHLDFLQRQIEQLEQQLQDSVQQDEQSRQQFELLLTIPGIGALTAAKFLAEVPDVGRFAQTTQLDAYAGLVPKVYQSGQASHTGPLLKTGNALLRTLFYMPALAAHRYNPIIDQLKQRLQREGKAKMTIVVAAMRKLLHLAYGVLKTGKPFNPHHATTSLAA